MNPADDTVGVILGQVFVVVLFTIAVLFARRRGGGR